MVVNFEEKIFIESFEFIYYLSYYDFNSGRNMDYIGYFDGRLYGN